MCPPLTLALGSRSMQTSAHCCHEDKDNSGCGAESESMGEGEDKGKYTAAGPIVTMVWQGLNTVKTSCVMLSMTNPLAFQPGVCSHPPRLQLPPNDMLPSQTPSTVTMHSPLGATFATGLFPECDMQYEVMLADSMCAQ